MKTLVGLIASIFLIGCGLKTIDRRTKGGMTYKRVGGTTLKVKTTKGKLYATATSITYTETSSGIVSLNEGSLNTTPSVTEDDEDGGNGDTIDLGNLRMGTLKVNNLYQCGSGGTDKCTSAIIRVYTNDITGHEGLGGFVNTTYSYGDQPVTITGSSGDVTIGHLVGNANTLSTYTIPANDNRLRKRDFRNASQQLIFPMTVDFNNGGIGDYEMSIEIEVALGPAS